MAFIKYSSEVKNAVIAAMNRYYILQDWGFDAAYRQVRMELQRDGKQMPSTHTVWKWIKPYMFRNLAGSCKKTDLTDRTDRSDKLKFTPEVFREMYAELEDLLDALEAGIFPQAIPGVDYPAVMEKKRELRKLLKKARSEE